MCHFFIILESTFKKYKSNVFRSSFTGFIYYFDWILQVEVNVTIDCSRMVDEAAKFFDENFSSGSPNLDPVDTLITAVNQMKKSHMSQSIIDCIHHRIRGENRMTIPRSRDVVELVPTDLRINSIYYKLYCVFLNSFLASLFPLASLLYLNVCTVKALKQMTNNRLYIFCR